MQHGVITYRLLWAFFEPGSLVYSPQDGSKRFFIATECQYNQKGYLVLSAKFVDWDGERFGYADKRLCIPSFNGTQKIKDLHAYPATFLASNEDKKAEAIRRGEKFQSLAGFRYAAFSGMGAMRHGMNNRRSLRRNVCFLFCGLDGAWLACRHSLLTSTGQVDGRIVVDAVYYIRECKARGLSSLDPLDSVAIIPPIGVQDTCRKHAESMLD